ncbi:Predicted small secreted protein [Gracilibacillus orientalis]|uniref:Predicted small secreted protein n=1 Tax=Gracilibacillus orientalis TaxID=334253 RepID=A0A1I4N2E0_9BACI|nr:PepSY domain-containing protein [Gracilibacillus orientalis]SFM09370.1 Predicted small secreted protein [Gracilibacillus orientalis]
MNKKNTIIIAGSAFLLGYFLKQQQNEKQRIKPEKALKIVKENFQENYEVSGSWIYMKSEPLQKNGLEYKVYHGGITKQFEEQYVPYEFYVDALTGTVIDMFPQHPNQVHTTA